MNANMNELSEKKQTKPKHQLFQDHHVMYGFTWVVRDPPEVPETISYESGGKYGWETLV